MPVEPIHEKVFARFDIEGRGSITVELDGENAPITVGNFVDLVERGFYNDVTFHRVVDNFVAQAGDPNSRDPNFPTNLLGREGFTDPETGEERTIPLEIKPQGADEPVVGQTFRDAGIEEPPVLRNDRGTIAMARGSDPNSASSQFYFNLVNSRFLDGDYAVFGRITDGLSVMDAIRVGDRITQAVMTEPEPEPELEPEVEPEPEPDLPETQLTNISLTGEALFYEQVGTSIIRTDTPNLEKLLRGDVSNPGGNIHLSGTDEHSGAADFFVPTILSAELGGEAIAVKSLTATDWLSPYDEYPTFAQKWLTEAWSVPGVAEYISAFMPALTPETDLTSLSNEDWRGLIFGFVTMAGSEGASRFSDPNINYVQLEEDGTVSIGLAAHLDHPTGIEMSEVVKVVYSDRTHFLYKMSPAQPSGNNPFTGLYHLTTSNSEPPTPPEPPAPNPEPEIPWVRIPAQFWRLPAGDRTPAMRAMPHAINALQRTGRVKGVFRLVHYNEPDGSFDD